MTESFLFDKVCDGDCPYCSPEDYYTTVDIQFLREMKRIHDCLSSVAPNHTVSYWGREIDRLITEAIRVGTERKKAPLDKSPES